MSGWLGMALAAAFALVTAHRVRWRDAPGALMAAGMAVMSLGMAGIGPVLVSGPWWALGFVLVAVWPVLRPVLRPVLQPVFVWVPLLGSERAGPVCGGPVSHLLGGVAMVYMCAQPMHAAILELSSASLAAHASSLAATHAGHLAGHLAGSPSTPGTSELPGMPGMTGDMSGMVGMSGPSTPLALLGWALACYFLLSTIIALTRRNPDGTLVRPRLPVAAEAVMGFGTVVMLVAMT